MKISKAEKILLDFLGIRCKLNCRRCQFLEVCNEACTYMWERGLYENGKPVYGKNELEVEE